MKNYIVYIFFYGYTLVDSNLFIDIKTVGNTRFYCYQFLYSLTLFMKKPIIVIFLYGM